MTYTPLEQALIRALKPFATARLLSDHIKDSHRADFYQGEANMEFLSPDIRDAMIRAQALYDKHKDAICPVLLARS